MWDEAIDEAAPSENMAGLNDGDIKRSELMRGLPPHPCCYTKELRPKSRF
jgi:hypothetical protein